jgi:hypothetical protein
MFVALVCRPSIAPVALLLGLALALPAFAEPYIAFREGYKCSACHVNRTGGGKRNDFGVLFTQTDVEPLLQGLTDRSLEFSTEVGSGLFLGADFMIVDETLFEVDERLQDQGRQERYTQDAQNTFDIRSGSFYLEAQLAPERLSLYLDETVTPAGASSREAFVLLQGLPWAGYLKAGRLLLPYGIRVWDDDTFIRQVTGFNYDNQDLGLELGFEPGRVALSAALSNGTQGSRDDNAGKQVSSIGSLYLKNLVLGGSFSWNKSRGIKRLLFGPYGSLRLGPLTLMGEADWLQESGSRKQDQFILFSSFEYWHRKSVNFRLAFDFLDPYDDLEEDEKSRLSLGVDAFLTPNLVASAFFKLKDSVPQDVAGNAHALTLALHTFF